MGLKAMAAGPDLWGFTRTQYLMHSGDVFRDFRQKGDYIFGDILTAKQFVPIYLFVDATREPDVTARNDPTNPGFMPIDI
jgi:hypothetical protein